MSSKCRTASRTSQTTYHFTFTGDETAANIVIVDKKSSVQDGHAGESDLRVTADAKTWLGFLRRERNIVWALICRRIRLNGSPQRLLAFGRSFPNGF